MGASHRLQMVARLNPKYPPVSEVENTLKKLYADHKIAYRQDVEAQGLEWDDEKGNDPWKGLFNYSNAEYRDEFGRLVHENEAAEKKAEIWIWQEDNTSMPASKQEVVLDFRPVCSLVKMDQGFI